MRSFHCPSCRRLVFFDNFSCLVCGTGLGYDPGSRSIVDPFDPAGRPLRRCANQTIAGCNWLIPADDPNRLCRSCRLTVLRPNDAELDHLASFAAAEAAKRQLLDQLLGLGLPLDSGDPTGPHLGFRLMASNYERVITGYQEGTITLDLSESDDAHREQVRQQLGELYRTVLGHLRHEIGHFYWWLLIAGSEHLARFRELFGDERVDYQASLQDHYQSPGRSWQGGYISAYACSHPWEDWAETFAQYLHIRDGLETADAFGLTVHDPSRAEGYRSGPTTIDPDRSGAVDDEPEAGGPEEFEAMVGRWLGIAFGLNAMARSIGQGDLYPFVLSRQVVDKLNFVHHLVSTVGQGGVRSDVESRQGR